MKIESKEKLAKLLATEDLNVQHQQVDTAYFDIKNRTLILPIWEEMPEHLYDLLVGHEVGHALFTPTSIERLQKAYKKTSKACINIIEDARIEALVKKRYPGLRKQFFKGYKHLVEKDFFGLSKRPISKMNILDKINLHFKIPTAVLLDFNSIETSFVERIESARSFKDVEEISKDVWEYAKENKKDEEPVENPHGDDLENSMSNDEKNEGGQISDDINDDEEDEENSDSNDNSTGTEDEKDEAEGEGDETPIDEDQKALDDYMSDEEGADFQSEVTPEAQEKTELEHETEEVRSTTYEHFQERLSTMVKRDRNATYLTIPETIDWKSAIEDYKSVHNNITQFYASSDREAWQHYTPEVHREIQTKIYEEARNTLNKWKNASVKTVNHIAMEFERKKAADVYKKILVSKTGVLDTNKLFSAKYNDDVFKKNIRVPDGKNHGLVIIMDWSGSMADNIFGCIKQMIELAWFCKKVNIPFDVYSFVERDSYDEKSDNISFKYRHNDMVIDPRVCLRNYLSSRMSTKDFNEGVLNMCILANRFRGHQEHYYPIPSLDQLKCTPLNGAIMLAEHVIRNFKNKNNLQSVHSVWLTDGEASGSLYKYNATNKGTRTQDHFDREDMYKEKMDIYIKDDKTKKNYLIYKGGYSGRSKGITPSLFDILKERLDCNIVGFFLVNQFNNNRLWRFGPKKDPSSTYQEKEAKRKEWLKKVKKDGWFVKTESGYDEYYVIRSSDMNKEIDENLNVSPEMTSRKMAINFMKKNNQFKSNRVIMSRFVDLITENN